MNNAVISLGSNIQPQDNIPKAIEILTQQFKILSQSNFVKTSPIGNLQQADFLNGSVLIETSLNQNQLREELKKIETLLGRKHNKDKFSPRTIDLDITVWNNTIIDNDFYSRDFVRTATLQLLPNLKY